MDAALDTCLRLLQLAVPALLGVLAGRAGLFAAPRQAVDVLNRYALTIGFPALVLLGVLSTSEVPSSPAFWLIWPAALAGLLAGVRVLAPPADRGSLALVASFGNVAYLGLPFAVVVLGPAIEGPASLAVSVHVALSVSLGPFLLERWSGGDGVPWRQAAGGVLRLPLFWAPVVGLLAQLGPADVRAAVVPWLSPIASSAAPVALFVIGLYVFLERKRLSSVDRSVVWHLGTRLLAAPLVVGGLALLATKLGLLDPRHAVLHVLLASTPVAISTFAIADRAGHGQDRVARAIVGSSVAALGMLPLWGWLAAWLGRAVVP